MHLTLHRVAPAVAAALLLLAVPPAGAQAPPKTDTNMEILRDKLKADKKLLVAQTMQLSEAEGKAFWPIYDAYQADLQKINERLGQLIAGYAAEFNARTMTDDKAAALTTEAIAIEEAEVALKKTYAAKLTGVIPATKIARYIQVENKIRAAIKYDLAEGIPFVQ